MDHHLKDGAIQKDSTMCGNVSGSAKRSERSAPSVGSSDNEFG